MDAPEPSARLYIGNLPPDVTKDDVSDLFGSSAGRIIDVKLMSGFGFIEYDNPMDARDAVPQFHGSNLRGSRLTVQFARGARSRDHPPPDRSMPRPRRTAFRMSLSGLPPDTSWQDLKDFARIANVDVVYSEISRDRDGRGFVEFETAADLRGAVDRLNDADFKGGPVRCVEDVQSNGPSRDRYRSRSPAPFRRGPPGSQGAPSSDYPYDARRGPPPPGRAGPGNREERDNYRRRSPPPQGRNDYQNGSRGPARPNHERGGYRSPPSPASAYPSRGPPADDRYPPARSNGGRVQPEPYGAPPPPPPPPARRGGYDEPARGHGRGGGRRSPGPRRGSSGYDGRPPRRY